MKYRPDIDGLRGLAVLVVVLFHSGLSFLPGGFIGVDVFFVISGYLITAIILNDVRLNKFSYVGFYERRVRRILPALYVMMFVTLVLTFAIQIPTDFLKTSHTAIFAILFSSNIFFWRTTDYFSGASEYEFFLHTWSLGVEEQFYFIFPIIILLLYRRSQWLLWATLAALIFSFVLSVYSSYQYEWASYYLLPSRAWQMMMGALIAITAAYAVSIKKSMSTVIAVVGFLSVVLSAILYTKHTRFPGVAALAPTLGAAVLIFIGGINPSNIVTRVLSLSWLRWLGLISYSLYLWHWPVFAFLRNYHSDITLHYSSSIIGIVLSVLLAYLSWRFVESPFRNKQLISRRAIFYSASLVSVAILCFCLFVVLKDGMPSRIDPKVIALSVATESEVIDNPCMTKKAEDIASGNICEVGDAEIKSPSIAMWGDSHAGALKKEFSGYLLNQRRHGLFFGKTGCAPLLGMLKYNFSSGQECLEYNQSVFDVIANSPTLELVVLHARWALNVEGTRYRSEAGPQYVLVDAFDKNVPQTNIDVVDNSMKRTVEKLLALGKRVVIIGSVPEVGYSVPRTMANNLFWGKDRDIRSSEVMFSSRQESTFRILANVKRGFPAVHVLYPNTVLCDKSYCQIEREGNPLYFDDDHVSDLGARLVLRLLDPVF